MKVTNLITADILQGIDDINRKCHAMHLPSPPVQFFQMEVSDADGTVVEVLKSKSNSWVRNAYNVLSFLFLPCDTNEGSATFGEGSMSLKTTAGVTVRTNNYGVYIEYGFLSNLYNSGANANYGILIGTGNAAESFESNALEALIAHGTGSGQMVYDAGAKPTATYNSENKKWQSVMARVFTNSSGANIIVNEIGLAYTTKLGSTTYILLISRDVLATPVTVEHGQTLTITYTSEITYPA